MANQERRRNQQVGIFILIAIAVSAGVFYIVGSEQRLFGSTYMLYTYFEDVSGLRAGAPIRLAGMDVGTVVAVRFQDDLADKSVRVDIEIEQRYTQRVRRDSVASIATQGVLGDKYIAITVGSPAAEPMQPGEKLPHIEPTNMLDSIEIATDVLENLKSITREIDVMIKGDDGETAQRSIQDILASVRNIIAETEQGRGILHELIYDPGMARKVNKVLSNVAGATEDINAVTTEIKEGKGTVHKLIYDDDIAGTVAVFEAVGVELEGLIKDIRNEEGLLYALIYDSERIELVDNLESASEGIKRIIKSVEDGEGTIGGLIADPSVYQDLKTLLGRAERNRVLKAYVRQTMRDTEREAGLQEGGGKVRE